MGLNWFIPALVKSRVGSSSGTTGLLGTNVCPCFFTKKSMNCWRISFADGIRTSREDSPRFTTEDTEGTEKKTEEKTILKTERRSLCLENCLLLCLVFSVPSVPSVVKTLIPGLRG